MYSRGIMIRYFNIDDRDFYISLSQDFYNSPACVHTVPVSHFETTFDECMKFGAYMRGVIVECDGKRVGYGLISLMFSAEAGGMTVWLEELYILDEYRSKGLGKEFFEFAYTEFPNAKRYRLEVTEVNTRAIKLYESLGYEVLPYIQMIKDIKD